VEHTDSLLQSYRDIFLTARSILLAIALFVAAVPKPWLILVILPIAFYLPDFGAEFAGAVVTISGFVSGRY
jgi:hypothetical protein